MGGNQSGSESSSKSYVADSQQSTIHMAKGKKRSQGRRNTEVKANVLVIKNRWVKIQIHGQNFSDKLKKNHPENIIYNFYEVSSEWWKNSL